MLPQSTEPPQATARVHPGNSELQKTLELFLVVDVLYTMDVLSFLSEGS